MSKTQFILLKQQNKKQENAMDKLSKLVDNILLDFSDRSIETKNTSIVVPMTFSTGSSTESFSS